MNTNPKGVAIAAITFVLWLASAGLTLLNVYILRQVFQVIALYAGGDQKVIENVGNCALVPLALLYIVFVIGTAEYHRKHVGQPRSWRLFAITIAVQVLILLIPLVV